MINNEFIEKIAQTPNPKITSEEILKNYKNFGEFIKDLDEYQKSNKDISKYFFINSIQSIESDDLKIDENDKQSLQIYIDYLFNYSNSLPHISFKDVSKLYSKLPTSIIGDLGYMKKFKFQNSINAIFYVIVREDKIEDLKNGEQARIMSSDILILYNAYESKYFDLEYFNRIKDKLIQNELLKLSFFKTKEEPALIKQFIDNLPTDFGERLELYFDILRYFDNDKYYVIKPYLPKILSEYSSDVIKESIEAINSIAFKNLLSKIGNNPIQSNKSESDVLYKEIKRFPRGVKEEMILKYYDNIEKFLTQYIENYNDSTDIYDLSQIDIDWKQINNDFLKTFFKKITSISSENNIELFLDILPPEIIGDGDNYANKDNLFVIPGYIIRELAKNYYDLSDFKNFNDRYIYPSDINNIYQVMKDNNMDLSILESITDDVLYDITIRYIYPLLIKEGEFAKVNELFKKLPFYSDIYQDRNTIFLFLFTLGEKASNLNQSTLNEFGNYIEPVIKDLLDLRTKEDIEIIRNSISKMPNKNSTHDKIVEIINNYLSFYYPNTNNDEIISKIKEIPVKDINPNDNLLLSNPLSKFIDALDENPKVFDELPDEYKQKLYKVPFGEWYYIAQRNPQILDWSNLPLLIGNDDRNELLDKAETSFSRKLLDHDKVKEWIEKITNDISINEHIKKSLKNEMGL